MCLPAAAVQQHRGPFFVRPPPALPPRHPPRMWHRPPLLERRIRPATARPRLFFNRAWRETDVFWCACRPSCVAGGFWGPKAAIPARGRRSQPPCAPQEHGLPEDAVASSKHGSTPGTPPLCSPCPRRPHRPRSGPMGLHVHVASEGRRKPSRISISRAQSRAETRGAAGVASGLHGGRTRRRAAADLPSCSWCF